VVRQHGVVDFAHGAAVEQVLAPPVDDRASAGVDLQASFVAGPHQVQTGARFEVGEVVEELGGSFGDAAQREVRPVAFRGGFDFRDGGEHGVGRFGDVACRQRVDV